LTATYFVVAHFHYVMVGGTLLAYLGGIHFWWPKITGRMYPEGWGRISAVIIFLGFNLTFFRNSYSVIWECRAAMLRIRRSFKL
jgi:cytochrome c oxidase subunit 1